ncbi:DUF421 domain-containing protein [Psychrobacter ciconiae]|uniref:DUF421 domain-containing protein n=1 Tax=Psychrobacter ciconiae TaxID=1553449 RepID=UPI001D1174C5|nr:YetF domain-containing protein [Psychrobacter ciconiae]
MWSDIFIYDTTWQLASQILIRVVIMFCMIILFLRLAGNRGIRQLSIFELTILLSLGSIAGDPMFSEDLPLIQAVIIMSTVIFLYRLFTWLMVKYEPFETLLEGQPIYIVEDGVMTTHKSRKGQMSHDEFFAEMRELGVEHLGQVREGVLETNGTFSVLLFPRDKVRFGLPIWPRGYKAVTKIDNDCRYACMFCGHVQNIITPKARCPRCEDPCRQWSQALNNAIIR